MWKELKNYELFQDLKKEHFILETDLQFLSQFGSIVAFFMIGMTMACFKEVGKLLDFREMFINFVNVCNMVRMHCLSSLHQESSILLKICILHF